MKSVVVLLASILLTAALFTSKAQAEDFVLGKWGDSREQIQSAEQRTNLTPIGTFDYLIYQTDILNLMDVRVIYRFNQDQLAKGVFLFPTFAPVQAIDQFQQINQILSQKYGEALHSGPVFAEGVMDQEEINWPQLLQSDQVVFQAEWHTDRTVIKHQLAHGNGTLHHQLVYQPIDQLAPPANKSPF
jgi:hypothetical protein